MKKLLLLIVMSMFLISSVAALDWDNVKEYQTIEGIVDKRVEVTNAFGLGELIGYVEVDNDPNVAEAIMNGKDRETRDWKFDNVTETYVNGIGDVEFRDMETGEIIEKEYHWHQKIYGWYNVSITRWDSKIEKDRYGKDKVVEYQVHDHYEQQYGIIDTIDYESNDVIPGLHISLVTDVDAGDWIDAVPTFLGEKLTRHAAWVEGMNTGLVHYWYLNGTGDATGNMANFTAASEGPASLPDFVTGKIGLGADFEELQTSGMEGPALSDDICFGNPGNNGSLVFWMKPESDQAWDGYVFSSTGLDWAIHVKGAAADTINFAISGDKNSNAGALALGEWTFVAMNMTEGVITINITRQGGFSQVMAIDDADASCDDAEWRWGIWANNGTTYDGMLDEVGIWNRSLTSTEINDLYNEGNGMTYNAVFEITPVVTVLDPANSSSHSTIQGSLNYSVTDGSRCWNSIDEGSTNSTHVAAGTNFTGVVSTEGSNAWIVYCNSSDGTIGSSSTNFTIDTSKPITTFDFPLDGSSYSDNFVTSRTTAIPINWTISDSNLDSCLLWNGTDNITLTCGDGVTWINISYNVTQNFILYANDTLGNSNSSSSSAVWNFNVLQNSQTYPASALETSTNYYSINLSSVGSQAVTAEFFFEGSSQGQGVKVGTNSEMYFNISADAARLASGSAATNKTFWWQVSFGSTLINTTFTNQSIAPLNIEHCNGSSFNHSILNLTMLNERTSAEINGSSNNTDFEITFDYYAGSGNVVKNFSFRTDAPVDPSDPSNSSNTKNAIPIRIPIVTNTTIVELSVFAFLFILVHRQNAYEILNRTSRSW